MEGNGETYPAIVFKSDARLIGIGRFNEYKFMLPNFIQNALFESDRLHQNEAR
jgi:hypothetical protein